MNIKRKIIFITLLIIFVFAQYAILIEYKARSFNRDSYGFYDLNNTRDIKLPDKYRRYNPEIVKTLIKNLFLLDSFPGYRLDQTLSLLIDYLKSNPLDHEAYYLLYKTKIFKKSGQKNLDYFLRKSLKLDPLSMLYNLELARLLRKSGELNSAYKYYKNIFSKPGHMGIKTESDIRAEMAMLCLERNDMESFSKEIEKAERLYPQNWRIDFSLFARDLNKRKIKSALLYLENSYRKFMYGKKTWDFFRILESQIKELIKTKKYSNVKLLYDKFAAISGEHEKILDNVAKKFKPHPQLVKMIWGDKIHITMFNPMLLDSPALLNDKRGCIRTKTEHGLITTESPFSEYLKVSYSNAPGFIDFWYIPVNSKISNEKTSVMMTMYSDQEIGKRQIAVELFGNLYYSKAFSEKISKNRYVLYLKNIHDYTIPNLIFKNKDKLVKLSKVGFNTVCRSGIYAIEEIKMYFEDN